MMKGCDFSHWNSNILFDRYSTLDFSILKATEGTKILDKSFKERAAKLIKAKKPIGIYHFLNHNKKGQAKYFYSIIKPYFLQCFDGTKTSSCYVIVDVEGNCTLEDLLKFLADWKKISNIPLVVYTSLSWYDSWKKSPQYKTLISYGVKFWLAGWCVSDATIKKRMTEEVCLYQFTDKYQGLHLDCNYFNDTAFKWGYDLAPNVGWFFRRIK